MFVQISYTPNRKILFCATKIPQTVEDANFRCPIIKAVSGPDLIIVIIVSTIIDDE